MAHGYGPAVMADQGAQLALLRDQLNAALAHLDRIEAEGGVILSNGERDAIAAATYVIRTYRPRSLKTANRWLQCVKDGEEAWLLQHSVPGEFRSEAYLVQPTAAMLRKLLS